MASKIPPCYDDPEILAAAANCIASLSKDVVAPSMMEILKQTPRKCGEPKCKTLTTTGRLHLRLHSNPACDDATAIPLDGEVRIESLVTVYQDDANGRGVHAGDFIWTTQQKAVIEGRISGITNAGLFRSPGKAPPGPHLEGECKAIGQMLGRLCGTVTEPTSAAFKDAKVTAIYRLLAGSSAPHAVTGVIEGVLITPCH